MSAAQQMSGITAHRLQRHDLSVPGPAPPSRWAAAVAGASASDEFR
jgi:hypothetical protein